MKILLIPIWVAIAIGEPQSPPTDPQGGAGKNTPPSASVPTLVPPMDGQLGSADSKSKEIPIAPSDINTAGGDKSQKNLQTLEKMVIEEALSGKDLQEESEIPKEKAKEQKITDDKVPGKEPVESSEEATGEKTVDQKRAVASEKEVEKPDLKVPPIIEKPAANEIPLATEFEKAPKLGSALPPPTSSEKLEQTVPTLAPDYPSVPEVAIVLSKGRFYPSRLRLKEGAQTRLIFTTLNRKPAALIIERLGVQRWLAKEDLPRDTRGRSQWEITREIAQDRFTEIILDPQLGSYSFHDAISGARGEISVE